MGNLLQDLKYGLRMMSARPGFTLVAALTLAIGIGGNAVIFSAINAVLLRPLSFPEPERLVLLNDLQGTDATPASYTEYNDWKEQSGTFQDLAAYFNSSYSLTGEGEPEQLLGVRVSANLLPVLGIQPQLGRTFLTSDEPRESERVVMLSDGLWRRRFGKDPSVIGRAITLGDQTFTVIGILPPGVQGVLPGENRPGQSRDIWMALRLKNPPPGLHFLKVIGRLRGGLSLSLAGVEVNDLAERIREKDSSRHGIRVQSLERVVAGDTRTALLVLFGAVGLVLLIGCANVANLMLARAASRRKEIAIRLALGASRTRLVRQMLTESLCLSLMSGVLGVVFALWGADSLATAASAWLPRAEEIRIDVRALAFTVGICLLTTILFGLAPALRASTALGGALKEGQRGGGGVGHDRLRNVLVIAEVAISLVLLIAAGLLIRSFSSLMKVDKGFDAKHVVALDVGLSAQKYTETQRQANFYEQVMERVRNLPGVESAGAVSEIPLDEGGTNGDIRIEGKTWPPDSEPNAEKIIVSAGYFETMRIPLRVGRFVSPQDAKGAEQVVVVNEAFAKNYLPGEDPIGKRIDFGWETTGLQQIVGVVGNVKITGLEDESVPAVYAPHLQRPALDMTMVVRTQPEPTSLVGAIRSQVFAIDKDQPVSRVRLMDDVVAGSVASRRLSMSLLAGFAIVALGLAAIGVYGVMAYVVNQRTQEIGIRMALGAQASDVSIMVVRQGMILASIGIGVGLMGAYAVTRVLSRMLFSVSATDPLTFAMLGLLLGVVALTACYFPARRATRVDPMIALRYE